MIQSNNRSFKNKPLNVDCFIGKTQFQKSGALHPEYGLFVTEQRAIAARQCMKRAPNSRATADRVILLLEPLC